MVELFAVRFISSPDRRVQVTAPGPACHQAESSPRQRRLNEHLPGLSPVLLPKESFRPFPLDGIFTRFVPLRPLASPGRQKAFRCRPASATWHWIESPDYSPLKRLTYNVSRFVVGLLGRSLHRTWRTRLRVPRSTSRHRGGWLVPPPFVWLVARLLRLMPSIRITSGERFTSLTTAVVETTVPDPYHVSAE
jgi:hypothetical protein